MEKHVIAKPLPVSDEELEDEAQINVEIEAAKIKPGAMPETHLGTSVPALVSVPGSTDVSFKNVAYQFADYSLPLQEELLSDLIAKLPNVPLSGRSIYVVQTTNPPRLISLKQQAEYYKSTIASLKSSIVSLQVVVSISEDNLVATLHQISRLEDHIASKFAANEDPAPAASLGTPLASSSDHW
nr:uncharacterized protein LOC109153488 [Ipomoea batatas]